MRKKHLALAARRFFNGGNVRGVIHLKLPSNPHQATTTQLAANVYRQKNFPKKIRSRPSVANLASIHHVLMVAIDAAFLSLRMTVRVFWK